MSLISKLRKFLTDFSAWLRLLLPDDGAMYKVIMGNEAEKRRNGHEGRDETRQIKARVRVEIKRKSGMLSVQHLEVTAGKDRPEGWITR